jgi:integrative and conjugative element protein (TIGR02256 family)
VNDLPELWVHRPLVRLLTQLPTRPWEVGGWLLGFWTADERSVFVTHATPPASRGTPFGVTISGTGHQALFDEAWDRSSGHVTFLGDWHTHPGCPATPSSRDRAALRQLAHDPDFGTPRPLIAIVQAPRWRLGRTRDAIRWYLRHDARDGHTNELIPRLVDDLPEEAAFPVRWRWPRRTT